MKLSAPQRAALDVLACADQGDDSGWVEGGKRRSGTRGRLHVNTRAADSLVASGLAACRLRKHATVYTTGYEYSITPLGMAEVEPL